MAETDARQQRDLAVRRRYEPNRERSHPTVSTPSRQNRIWECCSRSRAFASPHLSMRWVLCSETATEIQLLEAAIAG